jgi:precorrin-3B C17-methyltransferase
VVGIGPGSALDRTHRAEQAIRESTVVVGYVRYLDLIADLTQDKELVASGMTQETQRCEAALLRAAEGARVALISSGDPGIYGMAGLAIELCEARGLPVAIQIIPGISAASAVGARLGAPLMLDSALLSLSDLLVPWEVIRARLVAVAQADLVTVLYNPRSHKRTHQLDEAAAIFLQHRPGTTPVGIGTAVGTAEEHVILSDLDHFRDEDIGMRSTVVIGNRSSRRAGRDGAWLVTPRGYRL